MSTRSELQTLATNLRIASSSWNGEDRINLNGTDIKITELVKQLLGETTQGIQGKIEQYEATEKSLKGRIDTAQMLVEALETLKSRLPEPAQTSIIPPTKTPTEDVNKALTATIERVQFTISMTKFLQQSQENIIDQDVLNKTNTFIKEECTDLSILAKLKKNSFRIIKNVELKTDQDLLNRLGGSVQLMSFNTLKDDLNEFMSSNDGIITDEQKILIKKTVSLLEKGACSHEKILQLRLISKYNGAPDNIIESGIADLAYEIQKSINSLDVGESFIFPGGFTHEKAGHAILYEIQRVRETEYHFSIFNTGFSSDFGQEFPEALQMFFGTAQEFRVPVFTKLKKEALVDQEFLSDLIRFQIKQPPGEFNSDFMDNSIHSVILKQLNEKSKAEMTVREPHDLQTWGTCSYDSVLSFLEYKLPPSLFIPFHYDMILRARGELNELLLPYNRDPFKELVDRKSCESIAEWKKEFDERCYPYGKGDLTLAKIVNKNGRLRNQNDLKRFLELLSDRDTSYYQNLAYSTRYSESLLLPHSQHLNSPLVPISASGVIEDFSKQWALILIAGGLIATPIGELQAPDSDRRHFRTRRLILWAFQELIDRLSPETSAILRNRNQALGEGNQVVLSSEIDLSVVFNYLMKRFEEIALCTPELLNITHSPLQEGIAGCSNILPSKVSWFHENQVGRLNLEWS